MDFFKIVSHASKGGVVEVRPDFTVSRHKDMMVRGRHFYAVYNPDTGLWSKDESDLLRIVDNELFKAADDIRKNNKEDRVVVKSMAEYGSNSWKQYKDYISKMFDDYHPLDNQILFSNSEFKKEDYASMTLSYPLEEGDHSAWDEFMSTLYDPDERRKIEWAIGAVISGDAKKIDKFMVLYGDPGSGKGTVLDVIKLLFEDYCVIFEAQKLGSKTAEFATSAFKDNPLVAMQYDSDLSRIEDNTKLNSITSHETILIREMFKPAYPMQVNAFIFLATNEPVQITSGKSGIIRRLIDVNPSGRRIPSERYFTLKDQIPFQLGAIAYHCLSVYADLGRHFYDSYRSMTMMEKTDIFFNFMEESYWSFKEEDGVTLKRAWEMYKEFADESRLKYSMPKYKFKDELRNYFDRFQADGHDKNGNHIRNYYYGFQAWKIDGSEPPKKQIDADSGDIWLKLESETSLFDVEMASQPAQYANSDEVPSKKWSGVRTRLSDLDTNKVHYVKVPENHIVIDFDLKNENGEKDSELNLKAASTWPPTYAEFSKGGEGVHLHYIYSGDVNKLKSIFSKDIEVKVFKGNSSLRRRLSLCNDIPIATISSGLPLKGDSKVINHEAVKSEKKLRELIERSLKKEFGATKPSIDFIAHIIDEAKESGLKYDISDMKQAIMVFAMNSTNQSEYCMKTASNLQYKSEEHSEPGNGKYADERLVFFDVEVFPNLFLVNWKFEGDGECIRMINPSPEDIGELFKYKLVGFNNRRYDNHILYARYIGYNNEELFALSQKIIGDKRSDATFGEAYNISYTDVYDFASAGNKKGLKKWEIELGLHHQELGLPWDEPVDEKDWSKVAEYCDNDVISTEAVFNHLHGDFKAREILADIAGMTVNDSTNSLTTRIIFGNEKKPQLNWYDLAEEFPGYEYKQGKNLYRGIDIGRGGYVFAVPGMYAHSKTYDVESMHPRSLIEERYLGDYTDKFEELVNIRLLIKHEDYESVGKLMNGKLKPYLKDKSEAKALSTALKTAINSVYGLTSATFPNPFRDNRNKNNIVALRGALFMKTLQDEVEARGFTVIHIKTDSIKIDRPTKEIEDFVIQFGKKYGYNFEVESEWDKICLVNDAVFIGKQSSNSPDAPSKWTATGAQFKQPYVYKSLFSKEPIEFEDCCVTMTTKTAFYLDMNEALPEGESNPVFVGRAGSFCPIKSGYGGGLLMRKETDGRLSAATGTKGYRWRESELVKGTEDEKHIDYIYFENLVDEAITDISKFGDYGWFVSDDGGDIPWYMPCGDPKEENCFECSRYDSEHELCTLGFDISEILLRKTKEINND